MDERRASYEVAAAHAPSLLEVNYQLQLRDEWCVWPLAARGELPFQVVFAAG
jgi:hypothetical protein